MHTKYLLTPGVEWLDGEFSLKATVEEALDAIEREQEQEDDGFIAYSLMGFNPEIDKWEIMIVAYDPVLLVRRAGIMLGIDIKWSGKDPLMFSL